MRTALNEGIIGHRDDLGRWLERLGTSGMLAVDAEFTGFNWSRDRIGGLCLAAGQTAIYAYGDAMGPAIHWLSDQVKRERMLVFHHAKGDLHQLRGTFGLHVAYPVHDTYTMSFLLDNRGALGQISRHRLKGDGPHELKSLASVFVDPRARESENDLKEAVITAGGRRGTKDPEKGWKADVLMAPPEIVGRYGLRDAWYTLELGRQFIPRIRCWNQPDESYPSLWSLYDTERWLTLALRDMEEHGIRVDLDFLENWRRELEIKLKRSRRELAKIAGIEINWNSAPQLQKLIFEDLGVKPERFTKTNAPSTDEVALLNMDHPIGAALLRYREDDKQHGTYARGLIEAAHRWFDHRIRCTFKQTGARTGRLSCEKPNLQQQTRESGVRRAFIPDEGLEFRFADYSQVEMRFAAHASNDPTLVHGFINDPDFDTHAATARKMYGLRTDPTPQQRKFAKIMNFAMLFGAGEDKVTSQLISMLELPEAKRALREFGHRASPGENPYRSLAQLLRQRYFREFPNVREAKRLEEKRTESRGFAMNVFGRHRYLDEDEVYKAFNTLIQGSAADQAKRGLVKMYRELQMGEGSIKLLLQIHDEVVYLSDGDPVTDRKVLELLNEPGRFRIPVIADMKGSKISWQDKVGVKL